MENLLRIHDLSDLISESQVVPSAKNDDGSPNPVYRLWRQKNWIVLRWIQAEVGPPMFSLVES